MSGLPRQTFLRGAAVLAAGAVLGGCRSAQVAQEPGTTVSPSPTTSAVPTPRNWRALDDAMEGHVVLPADGDFRAVKALFNSRFDDSTPAAVVSAMSTDDVRRAVVFASANGMKVAVRAGGHSYIGDSAAADAMVIDLRPLRGGATYDAATQSVTVAAGAPLNSVHESLAAYARSIPTGSCPTVGIGGLMLGGGLGIDARRAGLTCDALLSATVVLPDGNVATVSRDENSDLFWGLRGGGGGHFGVATSFVFRTFPTVDHDVVTMEFPEDGAAQTIVGWRDWIGGADRSAWGMVNLTASDAGLRCRVVAVIRADSGADAMRDIAAAVGAAPTEYSTRTLNQRGLVAYFSGGDEAATARAVVAGSDLVAEMTRAAADSIVAAMVGRPPGLGASVVIESLTGAVRDVGPDGSAFPWRRHDACLQWYTEPGPDDVDAAGDWLATAHRTVGDHSVGNYVNYLETDVPTARYFGANQSRLTAVRTKYDPDTVMYSTVRY